MALIDAVKLAIAAEAAYDADDGGPAYELIEAAASECEKVLARRPGSSGPMVDAAKRFVAWNADDRSADNADWDEYDAIMLACRAALGAV